MERSNIVNVGVPTKISHNSGQTGKMHTAFAQDTARSVLAVIDCRNLEREAFVRYLSMTNLGMDVEIIGCASVDAWKASKQNSDRTTTVIVNLGSRSMSGEDYAAEVRAIVEKADPTRVVVLGDSESIADIITTLECGASGYVPTSVGIDRIVELTRIAASGGTFLPRAAILAMREATLKKTNVPHGEKFEDVFTDRQVAVCNALRLGKSNKLIAYDLSLRESTVKVHIRNIMKKLNATNRTQAAFKLNMAYLGEGQDQGSHRN